VVSESFPDPANWAYFAAVSEQARCILCNQDPTGFLDHQLPSQFMRLDKNGMYRDFADYKIPYQPLLYDLMTRVLIALSLHWGYNGKYVKEIEEMMEISDELNFDNTAYLCRFFKKHTGCTPKHFRLAHQNKQLDNS
jgi:AraC-like DNA-binding protein